MPIRHNKQIQNTHLRKHWAYRTKTWFNQPARKERRRNNRVEKAARIFPRPLTSLKPVVHPPSIKYNYKSREGRGFSLEEIKTAKLSVKYARSIGIAVDLRRKNHSEESLQLNANRLKEYLSKLVLFPRGKSTKGAASKEQVSAAVQNMDFLQFDKKEPLVVSTRKVTEEEKKFRAFAKLRFQAAKKKNCGLRLLAKQKKAESAKKDN